MHLVSLILNSSWVWDCWPANLLALIPLNESEVFFKFVHSLLCLVFQDCAPHLTWNLLFIKDECLQTACTSSNKWNFSPSDAVMGCSHNMLGIRGVLDYVMSHLNPDGKSIIPLGNGDPSAFECFRTSVHVEDALIEAIRTGKYNGYSLGNGLPQSRR